MPPKVKITREDIVRIAVEIVRAQGEPALNARNIAARLQCSTQPIFSNFSTMRELRDAVIGEAYRRYHEIMQREMASGAYPPYKASGMGYICFAAEERALFQLLFMRDRTDESGDIMDQDTAPTIAMVQKGTGLSEEEAKLFHLEIWAAVHGIAAMIATNYLSLEPELISRMLTDVYQGLKKHYERRSE